MSRRVFFQYILGFLAYLNLPFNPFKGKELPVKVTYTGVPKFPVSSVHSVKDFYSRLPVKDDIPAQILQNKILSVNTKLYSSKMHSSTKMVVKKEIVFKDSKAFAETRKVWKKRQLFLNDFIQYTDVDICYGVVV